MALGPEWLNPDTLLTDLGGVALWVGALIIFAECGLLLGFFLPGDSLLFTIGLFIGRGDIDYPLWLACVVLTGAAFAGNVVGYEIGRAAGPAIFTKDDSKLFRREYVDKTMEFFDHYGPVAIVLARFTPLVRTFITVTAGVGKMDRRRYLTYSFIGAVLWAAGITVLGRLLGQVPLFRDHLEAGLLLLVVVSVIPMGIEALRHRRNAKNADPEATAEAAHEAGEDVPTQRHRHQYQNETHLSAAPPVHRQADGSYPEPDQYQQDPYQQDHHRQDQYRAQHPGDDSTMPGGIPTNEYGHPGEGYDGTGRR